MYLRPTTGPPLGGMQSGSRPQDPGKETVPVLGPLGSAPNFLPPVADGKRLGGGGKPGALPLTH